MKSLPLVSVIIPTLNDEKNIGNCLASIFAQDYPVQKLEVIVVDDKSTDQTIKIVKKYPVKILISGAHHGEVSKMIGFKMAKGAFTIYLDVDVELIGKKWFQKMLKPLLENSEIIGSVTRKYARRSDPPLERFITFDPLQRDSLYQFFSPSIEQTIIKKRAGYSVCQYKLNHIPPAGRCLYRRKQVLKLVSEHEMFLELDFLVLLVKNGHDKFGYVPEAGLYHHHASSLLQLIKKRNYNLKKVYFGRSDRLYKWFDLSKPKDAIRIICWVIYANLIIPSILMGLYKSIKFKDWAGMYEPVVNLLVTDMILLSALTDRRVLSLFKNG